MGEAQEDSDSGCLKDGCFWIVVLLILIFFGVPSVVRMVNAWRKGSHEARLDRLEQAVEAYGIDLPSLR